MKMGIIFINYQNMVNVCMLLCFVMYIGFYMLYIWMFDNFGFFWMNYDLDLELCIVGYMMCELGYYMVYKGKWYFIWEIDQLVVGKLVEEMDLGEILML